MATFKYFSDAAGEAVELLSIEPMSNADCAARFPNVRAIRYDGFSRIVGRNAAGEILPATRCIKYKSRPSLHVCSSKCLNGSSRGVCECSCGGRNHGRGMFTSLLAA